MNDYLKVLCNKKNIRLVYTSNKHILLSPSSSSNIMITIRAHSTFKNCPKNIASAIINYYTSNSSNRENYVIIETYIKDILKIDKFLIKPPIHDQKNNISSLDYATTSENKENSATELGILKITKTDFWGEISTIAFNESFEANNSGITELDIIVDL